MEPLRKELAEGVFLTYVPAAKFKTGVLGAQLITPLEENTVAAGALLLTGITVRGMIKNGKR